METISDILKFLTGVIGILTALLSILLFLRLHWPAPALWMLKLYASAFSHVSILIGFLNIITGLITASIFISLLGIYNTLVYILHVYFVTRDPNSTCDLEKAFGPGWIDRIEPSLKNKFISSRTIFLLPAIPYQRIEPDIPFTTIPWLDRKILCDIWRPSINIQPSGLAFIYFHGSAWYLLDKDVGTRPFFNHLAAQGHLVVDVAYRLAPETDMMGMVNDVKRAIVWMRENAGTYGIDPTKIVIGGGSAGAHLALLAAYTANDTHFTPAELQGKDVKPCAVISLYGPTDLEAMYYHTNQHLTTRLVNGKPQIIASASIPVWIAKAMGDQFHRLGMDKGFKDAGTLAHLLGGHPEECREKYEYFSPISHVDRESPPTLLIHGEQDVMVPVKTACDLYKRLINNGVKSIMHILPQTDHAFDLIMPKISPSAHNAIYDIERFLGIIASGK